MADTTIQWAEKVWNPVRGCSKVSEGCRNCYAMRQAHRFSGPGQPYEGLTHVIPGKGPQWTGEVRCVPEKLDEPLRWRKPQRIFVNSMSDLFHPQVPDEFIDRVFAVMALCPQHSFQVLTKRPERTLEYMAAGDALWADRWLRPMVSMVGESEPTTFPLPNVHLGVSAEDQRTADERVPLLLQTPAAVRFVSYEPALGGVDLRLGKPEPPPSPKVGPRDRWSLDWVIAGGESGPGARPCNVAWIRSIVDQCREAKVPCFVKQLGADPRQCRPAPFPGWPDSEIEYAVKLRSRHGDDPEEWPEDLRVREYPTTEGGE